jgi:hypothetical protein
MEVKMKKIISIGGDVIIDWIIAAGSCTVCPGGAGNLVRGLQSLGHQIELTTIYNPMLYPLDHVFRMKNSLQDFDYRNVSVRNYDQGLFQRFREGIKTRIFTGDFDIVVLHEETCIRQFRSLYADVRDTTPNGVCKILRLSSSDPWETIMKKIDHELAIVTFYDQVKAFGPDNRELYQIDFPKVPVKDTVGAGDTVSVWLIDGYLKAGEVNREVIRDAIIKAQEKVQKVGVFI